MVWGILLLSWHRGCGVATAQDQDQGTSWEGEELLGTLLVTVLLALITRTYHMYPISIKPPTITFKLTTTLLLLLHCPQIRVLPRTRSNIVVHLPFQLIISNNTTVTLTIPVILTITILTLLLFLLLHISNSMTIIVATSLNSSSSSTTTII